LANDIRTQVGRDVIEAGKLLFGSGKISTTTRVAYSFYLRTVFGPAEPPILLYFTVRFRFTRWVRHDWLRSTT